MSIFAELAAGFFAASAADTRALAGRMAAELPVDRTLALQGDLGAGKTTFVQGLAAAWHVREPVTSPTFTICNLHRGSRLLIHVDAYRITGDADWDNLLIDDFLVSPWCLVIEWPEQVRGRLPAEAIWLKFDFRDGGRFVQLTEGSPA